jgi:transposase InsO family protein
MLSSVSMYLIKGAAQNHDRSKTLDLAMTASGYRDIPLRQGQQPRLLSDNGPSFLPDELAQWLARQGIQHARGAPAYPRTLGKSERLHQTMKNRILLSRQRIKRRTNQHRHLMQHQHAA